ncbi:ABC-three component system protein [Desulfuromonas sp. CSMB_57]|uniref:ABC-three component system protein n=1 Tax=Desulfuromonas sp. CSMB_57 TaxID=2807629 RepID=UPI001CD5EEF4|nr:ABC-three component system protein [Desulfuromonas sp. CSMB_57]
MSAITDNFSACEQALGYLYQVRYALLQMIRLPEETACFIERDDDLDFTDPEEGQILASLKHKAPGDRLTDLSPDFWKSVRIWLTRFKAEKQAADTLTFFLFTTGTVAEGSFLENFLPGKSKPDDLAATADAILGMTTSKTILKTKDLFSTLDADEKDDFLARITIFDNQVRIENIPAAVMDRMRTVPSAFRPPVYERLEGWWVNVAIELMTGGRSEPAQGREVSEMLAAIADQFKSDNLPIDFFGKEPLEEVNPDADDRMFVTQLRALGLKTDRIRRAILDYYRAFEQRASWAREQLTLNGEVEQYDDRLVDEWDRYRAILCESLDDDCSEEALTATGRNLLHWVETNDSPRFRIRREVTEAYVLIGSYHMLANEAPTPRVHWHPRFMQRLQEIVGAGQS